MTKYFTPTTMFSTLATVALLASAANADTTGTAKLLTANFQSRDVVQVEVGDFHFLPGQIAPIHTHSAPAIGYVVKGIIIYQIEGEKVQILHEGDAFYEPVDQRILRFDNASATQGAVFVDFNLEQAGEPFIVFEKAPTEAIDRRTLPTFDINDQPINQVDVFANDLAADAALTLSRAAAQTGFVAEGIVELRIKGTAPQRLVQGQSFAVSEGANDAQVVNLSSEVAAKIITFVMY